MKRIVAWSLALGLLTHGGLGIAQQTRNISASDKKLGADAHPQLLQEFGGAYAGPQSAYVTTVGRKIAVQSGLSNAQSDFTITLLNSPVNNAFAVPGGYVYVTRQLLGLMNDEAELASVLGHEVGHVAARHASKRNTRSTIGQVLSGAVGILTGNAQLGQIAGYGAQLYTLRFSRQQEYEADDLGIRYLATAGYDPLAASTMLASLNAQSQIDAQAGGQDRGSVPEWASTHPNGADRVKRAQTQAGKTTARGRARNRDAFLAAIDGMIYGDDPKQGIVDGTAFRHPDLHIAFTAPQGYALNNGTQAVTVSGSGGQAQFSGGAQAASLDAYIDGVFKAVAGGSPNVEVRRTQVGGMNAGYASVRASSGRSNVDLGVFAYQMDGGRYFHFVTIVPAGQGLGPFTSLVQSFRRLNATEAAAIRPRRIDVVTVGARDSVQTLAARMAYPDYKVERFRVLNAMGANDAVRAGQKVKIVVAG
jgi:predicted Zn-dependent protease